MSNRLLHSPFSSRSHSSSIDLNADYEPFYDGYSADPLPPLPPPPPPINRKATHKTFPSQSYMNPTKSYISSSKVPPPKKEPKQTKAAPILISSSSTSSSSSYNLSNSTVNSKYTDMDVEELFYVKPLESLDDYKSKNRRPQFEDSGSNKDFMYEVDSRASVAFLDADEKKAEQSRNSRDANCHPDCYPSFPSEMWRLLRAGYEANRNASDERKNKNVKAKDKDKKRQHHSKSRQTFADDDSLILEATARSLSGDVKGARALLQRRREAKEETGEGRDRRRKQHAMSSRSEGLRSRRYSTCSSESNEDAKSLEYMPAKSRRHSISSSPSNRRKDTNSYISNENAREAKVSNSNPRRHSVSSSSSSFSSSSSSSMASMNSSYSAKSPSPPPPFNPSFSAPPPITIISPPPPLPPHISIVSNHRTNHQTTTSAVSTLPFTPHDTNSDTSTGTGNDGRLCGAVDDDMTELKRIQSRLSYQLGRLSCTLTNVEAAEKVSESEYEERMYLRGKEGGSFEGDEEEEQSEGGSADDVEIEGEGERWRGQFTSETLRPQQKTAERLAVKGIFLSASDYNERMRGSSRMDEVQDHESTRMRMRGDDERQSRYQQPQQQVPSQYHAESREESSYPQHLSSASRTGVSHPQHNHAPQSHPHSSSLRTEGGHQLQRDYYQNSREDVAHTRTRSDPQPQHNHAARSREDQHSDPRLHSSSSRGEAEHNLHHRRQHQRDEAAHSRSRTHSSTSRMEARHPQRNHVHQSHPHHLQRDRDQHSREKAAHNSQPYSHSSTSRSGGAHHPQHNHAHAPPQPFYSHPHSSSSTSRVEEEHRDQYSREEVDYSRSHPHSSTSRARGKSQIRYEDDRQQQVEFAHSQHRSSSMPREDHAYSQIRFTSPRMYEDEEGGRNGPLRMRTGGNQQSQSAHSRSRSSSNQDEFEQLQFGEPQTHAADAYDNNQHQQFEERAPRHSRPRSYSSWPQTHAEDGNDKHHQQQFEECAPRHSHSSSHSRSYSPTTINPGLSSSSTLKTSTLQLLAQRIYAGADGHTKGHTSGTGMSSAYLLSNHNASASHYAPQPPPQPQAYLYSELPAHLSQTPKQFMRNLRHIDTTRLYPRAAASPDADEIGRRLLSSASSGGGGGKGVGSSAGDASRRASYSSSSGVKSGLGDSGKRGSSAMHQNVSEAKSKSEVFEKLDQFSTSSNAAKKEIYYPSTNLLAEKIIGRLEN